VLLPGALLTPLLCTPGSPATVDGYRESVLPLLEEHCVDCHSPPEPEGGLDLVPFATEGAALDAPELWWRVREELREGRMPPVTVRSRPAEASITRALDWIQAAAARGDLPEPERPPGRTTLRRLNNTELRHALLDLLGVDDPGLAELPADGVSHGFDVIGETLSMPPIHVEKCFAVAERVAWAALPPEGTARLEERRFAPGELELSDPDFFRERAPVVWMFTNGSASALVSIERSGEYLLRARVGATRAGPDLARLDLAFDGNRLGRFEVEADPREPETVEARLRLEVGAHRLSAGFVNDYYEPENPDPERRDRNLALHDLTLVGPLDAPLRTPFEQRYLPEGQPLEAATVAARLARLAWRGGVGPEDVEALLALAPPEAGERERLRTALTAMLASPRFLLRVEPEPDGPWRELSDFELATRLAAFLWRSVPDETLLERATSGALASRAGRAAEVDRLLRDARASRLTRDFARQWLQLGRLDASSPDPLRFPTFDEGLRASMRRESELFLEALLREERPTSELLLANFTFVDARLARHYGLRGVEGDAHRRVAVPPELRDQRGGLLGQAAILTATSHPARTSPVRRGKWVLEALLATPPDPPPPGVDSLEAGAAASAATLRERLELHRADAACAVCHAPMDGLGFALEPYDAVGAWRERDEDEAIDANAELPGGVRVDGPAELRAELLRDGRLARGLLRHLTTFALGRGLVERDLEAVDEVLAALPEDPTLRELIHAVVELEAFGRRYAEERDS